MTKDSLNTEWATKLDGFCCDDNKIFCVEHQQEDSYVYYLTVYDISDHEIGNLRMLNAELVGVGEAGGSLRPCVDSSHLV